MKKIAPFLHSDQRPKKKVEPEARLGPLTRPTTDRAAAIEAAGRETACWALADCTQ